MKNENVWAAILIIVVTLLVGGCQINAAVDCGNKGGRYLVSKNSYPACVKEVK